MTGWCLLAGLAKVIDSRSPRNSMILERRGADRYAATLTTSLMGLWKCATLPSGHGHFVAVNILFV